MPFRPALSRAALLSRTVASLAAVALACFLPALALEGKVLLPDGRPAAGAILSISGQTGSVRTDAQGRFEWKPDPPVPFDLLVVLSGGQFTAPVHVEKIPDSGSLVVRVSPMISESATVTATRIPEKEEEAPP